MQSGAHVQQVWDSFVTHLKDLSESLSTAHDVFSQPEEDLKARPLRVLLMHLEGTTFRSCVKTSAALQLQCHVQGMSCTTLKRRKHKSLESLSKGKESVDQLLMQASQVYSVTSHWQSQVDTADSAKQEAVSLLATVQHDLQVVHVTQAVLAHLSSITIFHTSFINMCHISFMSIIS